MSHWQIEIIRNRMQRLGGVEADTEAQAIEAAAKLFNIDPARRSRIVVTRVPMRVERVNVASST
jgi:hypothetical protein